MTDAVFPGFAGKSLVGKQGKGTAYCFVIVKVLPAVLFFAALKNAVASVYVVVPTLPVNDRPGAMLMV